MNNTFLLIRISLIIGAKYRMTDYSWSISFMMSKPDGQSELVEVQEKIMVSRLRNLKTSFGRNFSSIHRVDKACLGLLKSLFL